MPQQLSTSSNSYPDLEKFLKTIQRFIGDGLLFHSDEEIFVCRSPGRLDLMGGNDDYTGGLVFEATIQEATWVAVQLRNDHKVIISNPQVSAINWIDTVQYLIDDFAPAGKPRPLKEIHILLDSSAASSWAAYIVGGIYLLLKEYPASIKNGVSILIESDVPIGKGVSSSAALEVSALKAVAAAFGISLEGVDLALKCQWIENAICRSASGVMDQLTVTIGKHDHFVPLLCQPCTPEPLVKLPAPVKLWGIDSGVRHQVAGIEYEAARAATFMGYQIICQKANLELTFDEAGLLPLWRDQRWNGYLANLQPSIFRKEFEASLPESMAGAEFSALFPIHSDPFTQVYPDVLYPVRACTRYAVEENYRVHLFVNLLMGRSESLSEETLSLLGELMVQSHIAYSECGLGSDATDLIVDLVRQEGPKNGLFGAKITGGGAGGTVAVLGNRGDAAQNAFERVIEKYSQITGYNPYIFEGSSPGADAFGVLKLDPQIGFDGQVSG